MGIWVAKAKQLSGKLLSLFSTVMPEVSAALAGDDPANSVRLRLLPNIKTSLDQVSRIRFPPDGGLGNLAQGLADAKKKLEARVQRQCSYSSSSSSSVVVE
jgi:hypothetical protein